MRLRNAICTACLSGLALWFSPLTAAAQQGARATQPTQGAPKPLAQSLRGAALSDYEGGKLLFINKDYANALIKFQHAYELSHDPRLLWNVAICYKELRRYTRMLATLRRLLDEGGPLLTEQDRQDASQAAKAVEAFVSPLKLEVQQTGATVYIDGEKVGTTPLPEPPFVDVGSHEIRIVKPGFKDATRSIIVAGEREVVVALALEPDLHQGRLIVSAGPDDFIVLDGKMVGRARWEGVVPSGGHSLRVTAPGMQPYQSEVLVQDDEVRRVQITLTPLATNELNRWLWIAGGAALLAGAVIGGVILFQPSTKPVAGTIDPPGTIELTSWR